MTIAFVFESEKIGQPEYDQLMKDIDREGVDAPNPEGYIAHLAGPRDGGGWRVVDIWDSEQAANAFYGSDAFAAVSGRAEEMGLVTSAWPLHRVEIDRTVKEIN